MVQDDSPAGTPADRIYFEDLAVDDAFTFGSRTVTRGEIRAFAERYDPQPFHVDEAAAEDSVFGGLVASGWHTVAVVNRMMIDDVFEEVAVMGGSGVDELRWPAPVRPGDTLSGRVAVADLATGRHDDRGYATIETDVTDQDDRSVLAMTSTLLVRRRAAPADD